MSNDQSDKTGELRSVRSERLKSHDPIKAWHRKDNVRTAIARKQEEILVTLEAIKLDAAEDVLERGLEAMPDLYEKYVIMAAMCMATGQKDDALIVWGRELTKLLGWGPSMAKGKQPTKGELAAEFKARIEAARDSA